MSSPSPPTLPLLLTLPVSSTSTLLHAARFTLHDRVAGVLVGSALGDAIGLYTEFLSAASAAAAYPSGRFTLTGPAPHGPTPFTLDSHRAPKEPGHWTDDTDHALLLLLSFLHTAKTGGTTDAQEQQQQQQQQQQPLPTQQDVATRLRVWVTQGFRPLDTMPLGLGRLVGTVVASAGFEADPEPVARGYWERTGKRVAPNGSLMRTHPLGVACLWRRVEEAFEVAARISRVTHVDPRHVKPEGGLDALKLDDQAAIGYVYKTLGSGVVLLRMAIKRMAASQGGLLERSRIFEDLTTDLIMRGGDADTNACFAGALLGGYLGYSVLPDHWKHGLKYEEWLLSKAEALCQVLGLKDGEYNGKDDKDTDIQAGKPAISQDEMEGRWMVLQQAAFKKMEDASKAAASKVSGSGWSLPWQSKDKKR
ncbi:hypothetical protein NEMBOFW57_010649 [Staphylotrichum longicolle]|uniref:ADP-ribosylglycohydrolase n=1 Tax=Staphylotrichum longicolle TaxID=669026 RepID=A0AAD4HUF9_9PEZI|nr:hypothetical protein NEMBOFW57_010649 [Staphylotrichum longicolle]